MSVKLKNTAFLIRKVVFYLLSQLTSLKFKKKPQHQHIIFIYVWIKELCYDSKENMQWWHGLVEC
jgi:hypothetical protein